MSNKDFCKLEEEALELDEGYFIDDEDIWNQDKLVKADDITVDSVIGHKRFGPGNHMIDIEGVPHPMSLNEAELDFPGMKKIVKGLADVLQVWGIDTNYIYSGPSGVGWHLEWFSDVQDHTTRLAIEEYLIEQSGLPWTKDISFLGGKAHANDKELSHCVGIDSKIVRDNNRVFRQFGGKHTKTDRDLYKTYISIQEMFELDNYPICPNRSEVVYPRAIVKVIYPEDIVTAAIERKKSEVEVKFNMSELNITASEFLRKEPVLAYALKYPFPSGERNDVMMKNMIAGLVQVGLPDDFILDIVENICSIQAMSVKESIGWLRKCRNGDIKYNQGELINWIKRTKLPIRYRPKPMIGNPQNHKELKVCEHKERKVVYMGSVEDVLRIDFECKECGFKWNQGYLSIDRDRPIVKWKDVERGLQKLAKVE